MAARFVLVHGAYHGGWCWDRLTPLLLARRAEVIAPDLPGHGSDRTPSADLTLTLYADHIAEAVRQAGGPVTLVGHSMAGAVIAEVAERVPDRLTRLVYLTAYMPGPGESIIDWARRDGETRARADKVTFEDTPCLAVDRQTTWDAFYQDAPEEDLDWVFPQLRPEPVAIFRQALSLTPEKFGRVPRDYISCRQDFAITADLQDSMLDALPARRTWDLDCGHSPFVVCPDALADILMAGEAAG
ncbi:MAG TPA: alpha/beta hydrolase [Rhodospirillaceae bacterium]|nr:alpha/beta hydrolase [Rhodospirillaceae bacterium]